MTLHKYMKELKKLVDRYPLLEVYYSIDDEGNDFRPVFYDASVQEVEDENGHTFKRIVLN